MGCNRLLNTNGYIREYFVANEYLKDGVYIFNANKVITCPVAFSKPYAIAFSMISSGSVDWNEINIKTKTLTSFTTGTRWTSCILEGY